MRVPRTVMAVGGVVLAASLIGFTNPKAVHGLTAALVQVTNTANNPAVTQTVGAQATNMVQLICEYRMNSPQAGCNYVSPAGNRSYQSYTVPAGESLVVTSIDVTPGANTPSDCYGTMMTYIFPAINAEALVYYNTSFARVTTHFGYPSPSGVVFASGTTPAGQGGVMNASADCTNGTAVVQLYGYLTAQ